MMKRITLCAAGVFAGLLLFSCSKNTVEKEVTLVLAEVNPPETIAGRMDNAFKEKVEELSDGKIKIDVHYSGILGDWKTVAELMSKPGSSIHMRRESAVGLAAFGCEKNALLAVPFTFANREHFWRFANSSTAKEILREPYERGMNYIGLFFGEEGFRDFFANKPITGTEDFKGLNIRTTGDAIMAGIVSGLQAKPLSVAFSDLYSAFKVGTVDVADQPLSNYLPNHFNEVAPNIILDGHTLGVMETMITVEAWESLSKRQQEILLKAGQYASDYCRQISQENEEQALREIIAAGVTVTKVDDITPWQKACEKIIKESIASDPFLYQSILEYTREK